MYKRLTMTFWVIPLTLPKLRFVHCKAGEGRTGVIGNSCSLNLSSLTTHFLSLNVSQNFSAIFFLNFQRVLRPPIDLLEVYFTNVIYYKLHEVPQHTPKITIMCSSPQNYSGLPKVSMVQLENLPKQQRLRQICHQDLVSNLPPVAQGTPGAT